MAKQDGPTHRVLQVLETVARHGPITLSDACAELGFSRAAIWRALAALREAGWVRMRLGDHAYVLRPEKAAHILNPNVDYPEATLIAAHLSRMEEAFSAHVCLAGIGASQVCEVIESTDKVDYSRDGISLVRDEVALAAQISLDRVDLVRLLRDYVLYCSKADRAAIEAGDHAEAIVQHRRRGYVLSEDDTILAIPARVSTRYGFGLSLRSKTGAEMVPDSVFDWATAHLQGSELAILTG